MDWQAAGRRSPLLVVVAESVEVTTGARSARPSRTSVSTPSVMPVLTMNRLEFCAVSARRIDKTLVALQF